MFSVKTRNRKLKPGVVAHLCRGNTRAAEAGESCVRNQLGLHSEILSQNSIPATCGVLVRGGGGPMLLGYEARPSTAEEALDRGKEQLPQEVA